MEMLKKLDAFPKTIDDVRVKTVPGAILSIISVILMVLLFMSEFAYYMRTERVDHLYVNTTQISNLRLTFDISFHEIPCQLISIDAYDDLGVPQKDIYHEIYKHKITDEDKVLESTMYSSQSSSFLSSLLGFNRLLSGFKGSPLNREDSAKQMLGNTLKSEDELKELFPEEYRDKEGLHKAIDPNCGNCYGAGRDGECCTTCDDVRRAYASRGWKFNPHGIIQCRKESQMDTLKSENAEDGGCKLYGVMDLKKASGSFHIAPHKNIHSNQATSNTQILTLLEFISFTFDQFNISHTVNYLSFGDQYPGIKTPLVNQQRYINDTHGMYQYFLKIVPTKFQSSKKKRNRIIESNQYSVTEHMRHLAPGSGRGVPGVYFVYEVAPIQALIEEKSPMNLSGFLTSVCAVIGGVFTVLGILDGVILNLVDTLFGNSVLLR